MDKSPDAFRTISEVAEELDVPQHVLRFWETRFTQIKPLKRGGGRRYYRPEDVELLRAIRHLLYGEGYTIRGVQRILKDQGVRAVAAMAPPREAAPAPPPPAAGLTLAMDLDDDAEPVVVRAEPRLAHETGQGRELQMPVPVAPRLSRDDLARLESILADIVDCQRLLERARAG
ncbi:MAG: MerR family transcriptional regulator [Methylobacteriaceae bacterium]|nr:MerR family transcriptional regulator [Methylobacteriaceae bacterium]